MNKDLFTNPFDLGETSMRIVNVEGGGASTQAPAKSLATLAHEEGFARIDAMKLDVEGAEDLVLEPFFASEPQSLWPRALILAYSPGKWDVDLCDMLEKHGYIRILRTRVYVIYELETGL